jgi:hypothetical protein
MVSALGGLALVYELRGLGLVLPSVELLQLLSRLSVVLVSV